MKAYDFDNSEVIISNIGAGPKGDKGDPGGTFVLTEEDGTVKVYDHEATIGVAVSSTLIEDINVGKTAMHPDDVRSQFRVYVNNTYTGAVSNGSIAFPYRTINEAITYINSYPASTRKGFVIELGSSTNFNENITIYEQYDLTVRSWGTKYTPGAEVRRLDIQQSNRISLSGVNVTELLNITVTNGEIVEISECVVNSNINLFIGEGGGEIYIKDVTLGEDSALLISGEGTGRVEVLGVDFSGSELGVNCNLNAPNTTVVFDCCMDLRCLQRQGNANLRNQTYLESVSGTNYCWIKDTSCTGYTYFYGCSTEDYNGILRPIALRSETGEYKLGLSEFSGTGSELRGKFLSAGPGSTQLRDNGTRAGYNPIVRDVGGAAPVGRTVPNTIKDHLNGISDALLRDRQILPEDNFLMQVPVEVDDVTGLPVKGGQLIAFSAKLENGHLKIYGKNMKSYTITDRNNSATHQIPDVTGLVVGRILTQIDNSNSPVNLIQHVITAIQLADDTYNVTFDSAFQPIVNSTGTAVIYNMEPGLCYDIDIGSASAGVESITIENDTDTPGNPLSVCFHLTNGQVAYLHVADMAAYTAGNGININGELVISLKLKAGTTGLEVTNEGLGIASGYSLMTTAQATTLNNAVTTQMLLPPDGYLKDYYKLKTGEASKSLSTEDYTSAEKQKLSGLLTGAEYTTAINAKMDIVTLIQSVAMNATTGVITVVFSRSPSTWYVRTLDGTNITAGTYAGSGTTRTFTPTAATTTLVTDWTVYCT